jgi:hypothetical protein
MKKKEELSRLQAKENMTWCPLSALRCVLVGDNKWTGFFDGFDGKV